MAAMEGNDKTESSSVTLIDEDFEEKGRRTMEDPWYGKYSGLAHSGLKYSRLEYSKLEYSGLECGQVSPHDHPNSTPRKV